MARAAGRTLSGAGEDRIAGIVVTDRHGRGEGAAREGNEEGQRQHNLA
jgi:hypothetical protein